MCRETRCPFYTIIDDLDKIAIEKQTPAMNTPDEVIRWMFNRGNQIELENVMHVAQNVLQEKEFKNLSAEVKELRSDMNKILSEIKNNKKEKK